MAPASFPSGADDRADDRADGLVSPQVFVGEGPADEAFVGEVDAGKIQPQRSKILSSVTVSWDFAALPWDLLKRGSRVAVIAPSGPVDQTLLDHGLLRLRSWGLVPVLGRSVSSVDGFTAGPDSKRAEDLLWALSDPLVEAVCVARGGYGLVRVLDLIDWDLVSSARPRPIVGMSDCTALHEALRVHISWPSLLGPHVGGLLAKGVAPGSVADGPTHDSFVSAVFGEVAGAELVNTGDSTPYWGSARVLRGGEAVAPWFGGNLAVLASISGSAEGVGPTVPFVAVLEDVNEAPYRIDRMLMQLVRSGWFSNAVGVVCGEWVSCGDADEVEAVLCERLGFIGGPMVVGAPFGHGDRHLTIPLGVPIALRAGTAERTL
jgi:muramoyltetrapeptide carboxypeptidase